ncbi:hypothetical protein DIPPA_24198 [Diplonema papillatum]|nr:hypothetical protein DIPPA_24198 [Diplonema papillatum]
MHGMRQREPVGGATGERVRLEGAGAEAAATGPTTDDRTHVAASGSTAGPPNGALGTMAPALRGNADVTTSKQHPPANEGRTGGQSTNLTEAEPRRRAGEGKEQESRSRPRGQPAREKRKCAESSRDSSSSSDCTADVNRRAPETNSTRGKNDAQGGSLKKEPASLNVDVAIKY